MGLRRQAREFADEPQDTGGLPVRITGVGRIAGSSGGGSTVEPGKRFVDISVDRRDLPTIPLSVGLGVPAASSRFPAIPSIPDMVGPRVFTPKSQPNARPVAVSQKEPALPAVKIKTPLHGDKGKKMGLDLGDILNTGLDLYGKYLGLKNPSPSFVSSPAGATAAVRLDQSPGKTYWPEGYGVNEMAGPQFIANTPGGGIPFGEFIAEPPTEAIADGMKGWAYKKSCGEWKWTKSRSRRRRKLLTESDYNGLLKLQTLKVNSNMNIAIAKSIGR